MTDPPPPLPQRRPRSTLPPWFNHFLFVLTLFSTFVVGTTGGSSWGEAITNGVLYMASIMGILFCHEAGHYVMARINRVPASLPYFIPAPPFLGIFGTFGAVIVMKGRIRSRNALMEIGAAGPLAGLAVALPVLYIGLTQSPVEPVPELGHFEGNSILYLWMKQLACGDIPYGQDVVLSPMAKAGWAGLLVTMLNLIPISQLDGGHIVYAMAGRHHHLVSRLVLAGLFALGACIVLMQLSSGLERGYTGETMAQHVMAGMNWFFLGFLLLVLTRRRGLGHPPTDDEEISWRHRAVGILCLVLFILMFTPVPLRLIY